MRRIRSLSPAALLGSALALVIFLGDAAPAHAGKYSGRYSASYSTCAPGTPCGSQAQALPQYEAVAVAPSYVVAQAQVVQHQVTVKQRVKSRGRWREVAVPMSAVYATPQATPQAAPAQMQPAAPKTRPVSFTAESVAEQPAQDPAQAQAVAAPQSDPYGFTAWLNGQRAQYGLGAVGHDPNLSAWAAANNSHQLASGMGHYVMGPARRQNSGWGASRQVFPMWMGSGAHRAALLDPSISWVGIAASGAYWTYNAY